MRSALRAWIVPLLLVAAAGVAAAEGVARSALRTVEGSVVATGEMEAEGSLPVVTIDLATRTPDAERITIALAPQEVLDAIDFEVAAGDVFRARIFVGEAGPARAHKVLNLSRETMVRLRTLHQVPLWDRRGEWTGGPCRRHAGPRGPRYRGGR